MYYFLKTTIENGQQTQEVFAYNTENEATVAYHSACASIRSHHDVIKSMCLVINISGVVLQSDIYDKNDELSVS